MLSYPKGYTEAIERTYTKGLREDAAAAAKKAGSNKTARVKGFRFPRRAAGFKMPSDK